jgi:hypothetical protein
MSWTDRVLRLKHNLQRPVYSDADWARQRHISEGRMHWPGDSCPEGKSPIQVFIDNLSQPKEKTNRSFPIDNCLSTTQRAAGPGGRSSGV